MTVKVRSTNLVLLYSFVPFLDKFDQCLEENESATLINFEKLRREHLMFMPKILISPKREKLH